MDTIFCIFPYRLRLSTFLPLPPSQILPKDPTGRDLSLVRRKESNEREILTDLPLLELPEDSPRTRLVSGNMFLLLRLLSFVSDTFLIAR